MTVAINGVTGKSGNYRADLDKHLAQLHQVADIPVLTGIWRTSQADVEALMRCQMALSSAQKL